MVDFKFFHKFSCSCKRLSFDDNSQLIIVTLGWETSVLLILKALISIAKIFELPLHVHSFLSSFGAKYAADVVSCLCCFMIHFELK